MHVRLNSYADHVYDQGVRLVVRGPSVLERKPIMIRE